MACSKNSKEVSGLKQIEGRVGGDVRGRGMRVVVVQTMSGLGDL